MLHLTKESDERGGTRLYVTKRQAPHCTRQPGRSDNTTVAGLTRHLETLSQQLEAVARRLGIVLDPGEGDWVHPSQLAGMYLTPRAADGTGGELVGTLRSFAPPRYVAPVEYWRRERSAEDHPDA